MTRRKRVRALTRAVRAELAPVQRLADALNGQAVMRLESAADTAGAAFWLEEPELGQVRAVVEAKRDRAERFNELAQGVEFKFQYGWRGLDGQWEFGVPMTPAPATASLLASGVNLVTNDSLGWGVALLAGWLSSRHRDRLKRCPQCRRWFVDETRNKSAIQCSRACTIRAFHAQRAKKLTEKLLDLGTEQLVQDLVRRAEEANPRGRKR